MKIVIVLKVIIRILIINYVSNVLIHVKLVQILILIVSYVLMEKIDRAYIPSITSTVQAFCS